MCDCVKTLPEWAIILLVLSFIFGLVLVVRFVLSVIGDNLYRRYSIWSRD